MSLPWQPEGDGVDSTAFVMPPDLGVKGRVPPPPELSRIDEEEETEPLEDLVPGQSESLTVQDILENDGSGREPADFLTILPMLRRMCQRRQEFIQMHPQLSP